MDRKDDVLNELFVLAMEQRSMIYMISLYNEFQAAIACPNIDSGKVAEIIKKAPGMTAAVLRLANSSYYGFSKRIGTVKHALSVLGYKTVGNFLLSQAIKESFSSKNRERLNSLWEHSLATAIAAQEIAKIKHPDLAEHAFTVGLLHDIGKYMLLSFKKEEMGIIFKKIEEDQYQYSTTLELEVFDVDHQEIGGFLLKKWLFPESVVNSVQTHHNLSIETKSDVLPIMIAIANNIAKAAEIGRSTSGLIESLPVWIWAPVGINEKNFADIVRQTKTKFYQLK